MLYFFTALFVYIRVFYAELLFGNIFRVEGADKKLIL